MREFFSRIEMHEKKGIPFKMQEKNARRAAAGGVWGNLEENADPAEGQIGARPCGWPGTVQLVVVGLRVSFRFGSWLNMVMGVYPFVFVVWRCFLSEVASLPGVRSLSKEPFTRSFRAFWRFVAKSMPDAPHYLAERTGVAGTDQGNHAPSRHRNMFNAFSQWPPNHSMVVSVLMARPAARAPQAQDDKVAGHRQDFLHNLVQRVTRTSF